MPLEDLNRRLSQIHVVSGQELNTDPLPSKTRMEEWDANREELRQANALSDWPRALEALVHLGNMDDQPEAYKAMSQAAWLALKTDTPAVEVTMVLYNLLVSLGPRHRASGPIASLANLIAHHRSPNHPDRELAASHAGQMLHFVATGQGLETGEEFQKFVQANHLDDPDHFVPIVMETLEALAQGEWWIDTQAVQEEMLSANARDQEKGA